MALIVIVGHIGLIMIGLPWLAARVRRRGTGGGMLGPFEEIWHPAGHRARLEVEVQEQRPVTAPAPGDPPDELSNAAAWAALGEQARARRERTQA